MRKFSEIYKTFKKNAENLPHTDGAGFNHEEFSIPHYDNLVYQTLNTRFSFVANRKKEEITDADRKHNEMDHLASILKACEIEWAKEDWEKRNTNEDFAGESKIPYTERALIQRAIRSRVGAHTNWPRWMQCEHIFMCGRTVAMAICTKYGFNPEEKD